MTSGHVAEPSASAVATPTAVAESAAPAPSAPLRAHGKPYRHSNTPGTHR